MSKTVNIHFAKTHLSRLLVEVAEGEEVIIAKSGTPMARLVSMVERPARRPGRFVGAIRLNDDDPPASGDDSLQLQFWGEPSTPTLR